MVSLSGGALNLPVPDDSDPWWLLPDTIRSMATQLELTAKPVPVGYTAQWETGGGTHSLGSTGDSRAMYWRLGQDLVKVYVWMRFNGTGISGSTGVWDFDLPFDAWGVDAVGFPVQTNGSGIYWDDSAGEQYRLTPKVRATDPTEAVLYCDPTVAGGPLRTVNGTTPITPAAGDQVHWWLDYKAVIP